MSTAAPRKLRSDRRWIRVEEPRGTGDLLAVHGALAAALGTMFAVAWGLNPGNIPVEVCRLHAWTGMACPTCGGTRVFHALVHGRIGEALHISPFLSLVFVVLFTMLLWNLAALAARRIALPGPALRNLLKARALWIGLGIAWLADWMYRVWLLRPG